VGHVSDPSTLSNWGFAGQTAKFALIGGLTSEAVGGNFAEGFSIGAAGYLFNEGLKRAAPERVNDFGTPGVMRLASKWV
jgi:hypothetical protein